MLTDSGLFDSIPDGRFVPDGGGIGVDFDTVCGGIEAWSCGLGR